VAKGRNFGARRLKIVKKTHDATHFFTSRVEE